MKAKKKLEKRLKEMGYKNFEVLSAIEVEEDIFESEMKVRGKKVYNRVALNEVKKFKQIGGE